MECHFQIFHEEVWKDCALLTLLEPAGGNPHRRMQQAGVDDDIVAFLRPHIATQIEQLKALGEH